MGIHNRWLVAALLTIGAWGAAATPTEHDTSRMVLAQPGEIPILITAPHGGYEAIPGVPPRRAGKTLRDKNTLEIAEALADAVQERLGKRPYVVAARFARLYIDANRAASQAFDTAEAPPYYEAYHRQIANYVSELKQKHPGGALLLDIHGQSTDNRAIYRGTRHGSTVSRLLERFGCAALTGEKSLFGVLAIKGHRVIPTNIPDDCLFEEDRYVGGFTVATYGSHHRTGIDAIQIELGGDFRRTTAITADLAEAVSVFYKTYLDEHQK